MRKIFAIFSVALLFAACNKHKDYDTLIQGTWLCQEVNNLIVPTNQAFVMSVGVNSVTMAYNADTVWAVEAFPYMFDDDDEFNVAGGAHGGEYDILSLSETKLRLEKNDVKYTLYKVTRDFESDLAGSWHGSSNNGEQNFEVSFHRPNFTCNDGNSELNGKYFLYGELLVMQYSENQSDKVSCWLLEKQNDGFRVSSYFAIAGTVDLQEKIYTLKR